MGLKVPVAGKLNPLLIVALLNIPGTTFTTILAMNSKFNNHCITNY